MDWEFEFIKALQRNGNEFWDGFFSFVSAFAEDLVFVGLIGLIYWCVSKRFAYYLGFVFFSGNLLNAFIKNIVKRPRPFVADKSGTIVNKKPLTSEGFSFPSGHSQYSAAAYGAVSFYTKKKLFLAIAVPLTLLIAFSRLYLGVHYPTDVITGLALGYATAFAGLILFNRYEKHKYIMFGIVLLAMFPGFFFATSDDFFLNYAMAAAFAAGVFVEERFIKFEYNRIWWKLALRMAIGIAIVLAFKEGLKPLFALMCGGTEHTALRCLRYGLMTFAAITLAPLLFKVLKV